MFANDLKMLLTLLERYGGHLTDDELTVHQFDLIIVKHASHLNHVSLRFSQKCVRYNSPDLYIESALAMCNI